MYDQARKNHLNQLVDLYSFLYLGKIEVFKKEIRGL